MQRDARMAREADEAFDPDDGGLRRARRGCRTGLVSPCRTASGRTPAGDGAVPGARGGVSVDGGLTARAAAGRIRLRPASGSDPLTITAGNGATADGRDGPENRKGTVNPDGDPHAAAPPRRRAQPLAAPAVGDAAKAARFRCRWSRSSRGSFRSSCGSSAGPRRFPPSRCARSSTPRSCRSSSVPASRSGKARP